MSGGFEPSPHTPSARAWQLLRAAMELPARERAAFARRACAGDTVLLAELLTLIEQDDTTDALLDAPLDPSRYLGVAAQSGADLSGSSIGMYRLIQQIGSGGMGTVYRAERIGGVAKHHVALKLIKRGMDSGEIEARFLRERDILAQLKHPHIARLIDGGVSDTGQAWFAMELVEGEPITAWCDGRRMPIARRIALFLDVCAALQYAHRNLVVHRDLKPGNVLVGGESEVKLLDFGIAKLLTDAHDGGEQTRSQLRLLTPEFAAPEQFRGEPVTTATDIYQLGLLLYELLSGRRAMHVRGTNTSVPPRLSAALSGPARAGEAGIEAVATARAVGVKALLRHLRGDLSRIVAKALNDDPARRYDSVGDLADDLRRYLDGRPVLARPDSMAYRIRKFVMRHKTGVAATALVALALIAAGFYSMHQARLTHEQAQRAQAVQQFLIGVFENANPDENKGQPITAHQLLEKGEAQLADKALDNLAIRADLTELIGGLYTDVGDYTRAKLLLTRALHLAEEPGIPIEIKVHSLRDLARAETELSTFDNAIEHARAALTLALSGGADRKEITQARRGLAAALVSKGNMKEAQPLLREILADDRVVYGERSLQVADDLILLGRAINEGVQPEEAIAAEREAIDIVRSLRGEMNTRVADSYGFLGRLLGDKGDFANAEAALRESVRINEQLFGVEHHQTIMARSGLLLEMELNGNIEAALPGRLQLLESAQKHQDAGLTDLAFAWSFVAGDYDSLGRLSDAEMAFRQSLAVWAKIQGSNREASSADRLMRLGNNLLWQGRYVESEALFREVMSVAGSFQTRTSLPFLSWSRGCLGNLLRLEHRYTDAVQELSQAVAAFEQPGNETHPLRVNLRGMLAEALLDAGKPAEAEASAAQALALGRKILRAKNPVLSRALFSLARIKLATGHADEAEPLLREALASRSPPNPAGDLRVLEVQVGLINAMAMQNKTEEAAALRAKIEPMLLASSTPYAADLHARLALK